MRGNNTGDTLHHDRHALVLSILVVVVVDACNQIYHDLPQRHNCADLEQLSLGAVVEAFFFFVQEFIEVFHKLSETLIHGNLFDKANNIDRLEHTVFLHRNFILLFELLGFESKIFILVVNFNTEFFTARFFFLKGCEHVF